MFKFILFVFFLANSYLFAQVVKYRFVDKKSGESIQNVQVSFQIWNSGAQAKKDTAFVLTSNSKGIILIPFQSFEMNSIISLKATHFVYQEIIQSNRIRFTQSDSAFFEVLMKSTDQQEIKEVIIKAPGLPDTVFQSDKLSVADFEIQKDGNIILLTYPKQLKKGGDVLLFDGQDILATFPVDDKPQKLIRDFRGNTHVLCENEIFTLVSQKKTLFLA
ncbi:MAG: hypothetical protein K9G31_08120, partial [Crocinitomicaceae bacterium]|nr:hypothetical protein [Crocinitomicaceae bacterium]